MDKFEKRWIRREFNKTNGMIFLYKILFWPTHFFDHDGDVPAVSG